MLLRSVAPTGRKTPRPFWAEAWGDQAIDQLASGLQICAYAADSLPEAITWKNNKDKGFLLAVQWHPERMRKNHPFSDPLALAFLQSAEQYKQHINNFYK